MESKYSKRKNLKGVLILTTIYLIGLILDKLQNFATLILLGYFVYVILVGICYMLSLSDNTCCKKGENAIKAREDVNKFFAPFWGKIKSKLSVSLIIGAILIKLLPTTTQFYTIAVLYGADKVISHTQNLTAKDMAEIIDLSIKKVKAELKNMPNHRKKQ